MENQGYFVRRGKAVSGPMSAPVIRELMAMGSLAGTDELSQDGMNWTRASEVLGVGAGGVATAMSARPFDVFISYSSQNKLQADAVCAKLEEAGVRCWIAPRDIMPGLEWTEAIINGIERSRVMVLIFSEFANKSAQVRREVERAISKDLPVVPFRVQNVLPTRSLEFCIGNTHWFDAYDPPLEKHIARLVQVVRGLRGPDLGDFGPSPAGPTPAAPVAEKHERPVTPAVSIAPSAPIAPVAPIEPARDAIGASAAVMREAGHEKVAKMQAAAAGPAPVSPPAAEKTPAPEKVIAPVPVAERRAPVNAPVTAPASHMETNPISEKTPTPLHEMGKAATAGATVPVPPLPAKTPVAARPQVTTPRKPPSSKPSWKGPLIGLAIGMFLLVVLGGTVTYLVWRKIDEDRTAKQAYADSQEIYQQALSEWDGRPKFSTYDHSASKAMADDAQTPVSSPASNNDDLNRAAAEYREKAAKLRDALAKWQDEDRQGSQSDATAQSDYDNAKTEFKLASDNWDKAKYTLSFDHTRSRDLIAQSNAAMDGMVKLGDPASYRKNAGIYRTAAGLINQAVSAAADEERAGEKQAADNYAKGRDADNAKNYSEALNWYRKAADGGNASAIYSLGYLYDEGHGVTQDYGEALRWYMKGADLGSSSSMNNIGFLYDEGHGVTQDYFKALEWYQKSAALGNTAAMWNIARLYEDGKGVFKDMSKAREWYSKAADGGDADAKKWLADHPG